MKVQQLWRYPVKSMGGEALSSADVGPLGIPFDRGWGVVDLSSGMVLTARRAPLLLFASARVDAAGELVVDVPHASGLTVGADLDRELSEWLGANVELRRAADVGGTYEAPLDAEHDANWVSWQGPGGAWHDSTRARVSLVSESTLRGWPVQRFRPNVLLSAGDEDALVGTQVQIGTCRLDVIKGIDRCVMVTRPQPGLARDLSVLQTIARERSSLLAIGALVAAPGAIAIGDELTPT